MQQTGLIAAPKGRSGSSGQTRRRRRSSSRLAPQAATATLLLHRPPHLHRRSDGRCATASAGRTPAGLVSGDGLFYSSFSPSRPSPW
jgi:hypothetical protein